MKQWKQCKFIGLSLAAMVALTGCLDPNTMTEPEREVMRGKEALTGTWGGGTQDFGNAVRSNLSTQIIDPAPAYAEDPPAHDGQVMIGAFSRYRTDKVKQPEPIGTF